MSVQCHVIIYPVKDIEQAKSFFATLLGTTPTHDAPYYVQFRAGDLDVGLAPSSDDNGTTGAVPYWRVADIESSLQSLLDAGTTLHEAITQVGPGRRVATVKDANGNLIGLLHDA